MQSTNESFRVPNSIVQGLTTTTTAELNKMSAFEMVTLLGLLAMVNQARPEKEVRTSVSKILKIIEVSKLVSHAVEHNWETETKEIKGLNHYYPRFSPAHVKQINQALLALHQKSVVIQRRDPKTGNRIENRVHILDMFGYSYAYGGKPLDLDNLPPGSDRVNVGYKDRPVWRIRKRTPDGDRYDRATGIIFRLNTELAGELNKNRGTIGFTLLARKVFGILRSNMANPATIRLIILVMRQTGSSFARALGRTLKDLGWDPTHPGRATNQLKKALHCLKETSIVGDFEVDPETDRLRIDVNRSWYLEEVAAAKTP